MTSWLCAGICFFAFSRSYAQAEQWAFLPPAPLFKTLIADPREPYTGITAYGNQSRFEGAVGATFEFLRYLPPDRTQWGWGVFGDGFILLDENGATFPMRGGDWHVGMYVSEASGPFSHRLEFEHQSAHLGDSFQDIQNPIFFSRENLNYVFSWQPQETFRLHAGAGVWFNMYPKGLALFTSLGLELYTSTTNLGGALFRGYVTGDLKWLQETAVVNNSFQLGIQLKFDQQESRDVRLALLYYNGNSEFGQFYRDHDEHWGFGIYFDP